MIVDKRVLALLPITRFGGKQMTIGMRFGWIGCLASLSLLTHANAHVQSNTIPSGGVTYDVSANLVSPSGSGYMAYAPVISFDADFAFTITHNATEPADAYSVAWVSYLDGMSVGNAVAGSNDVYFVDPGTSTGEITTDADAGAIGVAPGTHSADALLRIRKVGNPSIQAQQWDGHSFSAS